MHIVPIIPITSVPLIALSLFISVLLSCEANESDKTEVFWQLFLAVNSDFLHHETTLFVPTHTHAHTNTLIMYTSRRKLNEILL